MIRQYDATSKLLNDFAIDVYNNSGDPNDLVKAFVNDKQKVENTDWTINRINQIAYVKFN